MTVKEKHISESRGHNISLVGKLEKYISPLLIGFFGGSLLFHLANLRVSLLLSESVTEFVTKDAGE